VAQSELEPDSHLSPGSGQTTRNGRFGRKSLWGRVVGMRVLSPTAASNVRAGPALWREPARLQLIGGAEEPRSVRPEY
jgi:hypothetical protein